MKHDDYDVYCERLNQMSDCFANARDELNRGTQLISELRTLLTKHQLAATKQQLAEAKKTRPATS